MKGWRTLATAAAVIVLGLLEQFDITSIVPDKYDALALSAVGLAMAALRLVTTGKVGRSE